MNIPEINTFNYCSATLIEVYDEPLMFPDEWDEDNAIVVYPEE